MNVLSLFDGMACGRIALERAGIPVTNYFASEIDKYAMQIADKNYPDIIRVSDVTKVDGTQLPKIDLLIGGSPCQDLRPGRDGLTGEKSKLFYEYVRVLGELRTKNPDVYFLLENVAVAKKEDQEIISGILGVEPVMIDSALVSAQQRKRLYWTNLPNVTQPEDRGILLRDIVEPLVFNLTHVPSQKCIAKIIRRKWSVPRILPDKTGTLSTRNNAGRWEINAGTTLIPVSAEHDGLLYRGDDEFSPAPGPFDRLLKFLGGFEKGRRVKGSTKVQSRLFSQGYRVYDSSGKSNTLQSRSVGGLGGATGLYLLNQRPDLSPGEHILRKLTPVECERLQTVPDNYTEGVSKTQRYKMLGNGWTVDVIAHLFSPLAQ